MIAFFSLLSGVFLLDLATKSAIRAYVPLAGEIKLLPFFSIVHVQNTGVAFGLFQNRNTLLILVGGAVMAAIITIGVRLIKQDRFSGLVMATVVGGAIGNLTDRVVFGRVTDFLDFYVASWHWPAFNVADSAICVGAALLLWHGIRGKQA
jgi:signal peptidase II